MEWVYGTVLHRFQRRIVEDRGRTGLKALCAELDRRDQQFRQNARIAYGRDLPKHVLDAFALLYIFFRTAERLGVVPAIGREPPAIWSVFERFMAARPRPVTAAAILR